MEKKNTKPKQKGKKKCGGKRNFVAQCLFLSGVSDTYKKDLQSINIFGSVCCHDKIFYYWKLYAYVIKVFGKLYLYETMSEWLFTGKKSFRKGNFKVEMLSPLTMATRSFVLLPLMMAD